MDDESSDIGLERGYNLTDDNQLPPTTEEEKIETHEKVEDGDQGVVEGTDVAEINTEDEDVIPPHPHADVLDAFVPHAWQLEAKDPIPSTNLDTTSARLIDRKELLDDMVVKLKEERELVFSMKRHSYRSFRGIVCVVAFSTRTDDYIVDTIVLKKDDLAVLKDILANPAILKIVHHAQNTIEAMQKHFSLYLVNLFDPHMAALKLKPAKPVHASLPYLVKTHCGVEFVALTGENGDYRVRPIQSIHMAHLQQEVHYLLHIYDVLRNQLIEQKILGEVYTATNAMCRFVWYEGKERFRANSHVQFLKKGRGYTGGSVNWGTMNSHQQECFRLLFEWRWRTAEANDEGFTYTLPNRPLLKIAKDLPRDVDGLKACCGTAGIPPLLLSDADRVLELITKSLETPFVEGKTIAVPQKQKQKITAMPQIQNKKKQGRMEVPEYMRLPGGGKQRGSGGWGRGARGRIGPYGGRYFPKPQEGYPLLGQGYPPRGPGGFYPRGPGGFHPRGAGGGFRGGFRGPPPMMHRGAHGPRPRPPPMSWMPSRMSYHAPPGARMYYDPYCDGGPGY